MRRIVRILVVLGVLVSTNAAPAAASVDETPVSAVGWMAEIYEFTSSFTGPVVHEHLEGLMRVVGHEYLSGSVQITVDNEINYSVGTGHLQSHWTSYSDAFDESGWTGISSGKWSISLEGYVVESRLVGAGFGAFEGMQLRLDDLASSSLPVHVFEGEVLIAPSA